MNEKEKFIIKEKNVLTALEGMTYNEAIQFLEQIKEILANRYTLRAPKRLIKES